MTQTNDLFEPGRGDELTRQLGRASEGPDNQVSAEEAAAQARAEVDRANARAAEAERRATEEATRRTAAEAQVREAQVNTFGAHESRVLSAIDAQNRIIDGAKAALANAFQSQDGMALAEAQSQLSAAHAALAQLNAQKEWIGQEKVRQEAEARRPAPQQQQNVDGVFVDTPSGRFAVSATDRDWMDKHPRFYDDNEYHQFAIAAHSTIERSGVRPGTPAYYRELDNAMTRYERLEAADRGEDVHSNGNGSAAPMSQRQQQRRAPASSFAAPASRATAPQQRGNGVMTALQVARRIGPGVTEEDVAQYAKIAGMSLESYLKEQSEIAELERTGQPTGMRTDEVYR